MQGTLDGFVKKLSKDSVSRGPNNDKSSVVPEKKRKTKADYDKTYDHGKRKREFKDSWFVDFPWLESDEEGICSCKICKLFPLLADKSSGLFKGQAVSRRDTLSAHEKSSCHAQCKIKLDDDLRRKKNQMKVGDLDRVLKKYHHSQVERYKKLFITAYSIMKKNRPFTDFEYLCELQKVNGVPLGNDHINSDACTSFVKSISSVMLNDINDRLSRARFFSVMSDGSTDCSTTDQECILVRFVDPDTKQPTTELASIQSLETPNADGITAAIKTGLKEIGVDLVADSGLVCVNMDGASVNMGSKNGVAKQLSSCVEHPVVVTHCVAHRLELGVLDAAKTCPYLESFESTLKRLYKFYSFSPKRRANLRNLAEVLELDFVMYSDIKSIRWVASKSRAVKAAVKDYQATVTHLEQVLETSKRTDEKAQAKKIHHDIIQIKFVKYMHLMMDILTCVTETSQQFQIADLLIMECSEAINTLYTQLHAMTVSPGQNLQEFYTEFHPSTRMYKGIRLNGPLPKDFLEDNDIQTFISKMGDDILHRFENLTEPPLCYFKAFDTRNYPAQLKPLAVHCNESVQALCDFYKDMLSAEERAAIPNEFQKVKVRYSMTGGGHPLGFLIDVLKDSSMRYSSISRLIELMLCISPSTAACERAFSTMNIVKTPTRSVLKQENLVNQMRIVLSGPAVEEFDPSSSVLHWLDSGKGSKHLTYKQRQPKETVSEQPSTSQGSSIASDTEQLAHDVFNTLSVEQRSFFKENMSKDQCSVQ